MNTVNDFPVNLIQDEWDDGRLQEGNLTYMTEMFAYLKSMIMLEVESFSMMILNIFIVSFIAC